MANSNLTATVVTKEALRILHNECVLLGKVDRQFDGSNEYSGLEHGGSIKIRLPNQYTVGSGAAISSWQDNVEKSVTLTIATQSHIALPAFTSQELAQDIDSFSRRVLKPAVSRLASEIDLLAFQAVSKGVYNLVGTAGTTPASALVYLQAGQKLSDFATPIDDRCVIINPAAQAATVNALTGLFHSGGKIAAQYEKGAMGKNTLGFDFYMSQNVPTVTCGTHAGTPLVNGTVSTEGSTTIAVDGLGASQTVKAGEVFTVAGVYAVNPETKQTLPDLQQFVVTEDATADGSGAISLTVSPAMYTSASGGLQTIDAFPQDNAAITFQTGSASETHPHNLAFHRDAITFATAPLRVPRGVEFASRQEMDNVSMRIVSDYDITNDRFLARIDVLWGIKVQRPELACKIMG